MKRVSLQPAYVLHRRPYRETSFLVDLFTKEFGRTTVVAAGVRKLKSATSGLLQPFVPLLVSFSGKGELMSLSQVETSSSLKRLQGECLFAGFYLNELLVALLQKWDAHSLLYDIYEVAINALQTGPLRPEILRSFELRLLDELGYGVLPRNQASLNQLFNADQFYRFVPEEGFVLYELEGGSEVNNIFSGKSLQRIAREDWQDEKSLQDAKRLMRFVLAPLLGAKQIYSRQLFIHQEKVNEK